MEKELAIKLDENGLDVLERLLSYFVEDKFFHKVVFALFITYLSITPRHRKA